MPFGTIPQDHKPEEKKEETPKEETPDYNKEFDAVTQELDNAARDTLIAEIAKKSYETSYKDILEKADKTSPAYQNVKATIDSLNEDIKAANEAEEKIKKANPEVVKQIKLREDLPTATGEREKLEKSYRKSQETLEKTPINLPEYKKLKDAHTKLGETLEAAKSKQNDIYTSINDSPYKEAANAYAEKNKKKSGPSSSPGAGPSSSKGPEYQQSSAHPYKYDSYVNPILERFKGYPFVEDYLINRAIDPIGATKKLIEEAYQDDVKTGDTDDLLTYQKGLKDFSKKETAQDIKDREEQIKKQANTNPDTGKEYANDAEKAEAAKKREERVKTIFSGKDDKDLFKDANALRFEGKPDWFNKVMLDIGARTEQLTSSDKPFPIYNKPRIAEPAGEENIAYDLLTQKLLNPDYKDSYDAANTELKGLLKKSPVENLGKETDKRAAEKTIDVEEYVNPQRDKVLDLIKKRALRNFEENVMPKVTAPFIARGSFNTGARAEAQARARRDLLESITDNETQYLASVYDKARDTASEDKKTFLNYKLNKAGLEGEEIKTKGKIAEDISGLMSNYNKNRLLDNEALRTVGENKRNVEQRNLDIQHEEWKNIQQHPLRQVETLNRMIYQLPVESATGYSSRAVPTMNQQKSPWETGAGMLGQLYGMSMMDKKAEGGMIQNFAEGGGVMDKMKDQYLQEMMERAHNYKAREQNPWAHYLMGLGSSLASSNHPSVMESLGAASTHGLGQFMRARDHNADLEDKSLDFKRSIVDYLDRADDRKLSKRLHEVQIQKMMHEMNAPKEGKITSRAFQNPDTGEINNITLKDGRVIAIESADPESGKFRSYDHNGESNYTPGANNVIPSDSQYQPPLHQDNEKIEVLDTAKIKPEQFSPLRDAPINNMADANNETEQNESRPKYSLLPTQQQINASNDTIISPRTPQQKLIYNREEAEKAEDQKLINKNTEALTRFNTMKRILPDLPTGSLSGAHVFGSRALGLITKSQPAANASDMWETLRLETILDAAQKAKPVSNTDMDRFNKILYNRNNSALYQENALNVATAIMEVENMKLRMKQTYRGKFGSTQGFENYWHQTVENNPVLKFESTEKGTKISIDEKAMRNLTGVLTPEYNHVRDKIKRTKQELQTTGSSR